ncbi:MAG: hypothetical protein EOP50_18005 [Sphingobacteriales bacterium]|nr:MAG: hypothetical protein EOP50_18005 [Sphingobacteriales bacterium]
MKQVQLNFQEMVAAVLAHAKNHPAAWQDIAPVAQSFGELGTVSAALETAAKKQVQPAAGPKNGALDALFAETQKTGQKIAAYALRHQDELLLAQVRVRTYQLEDMAEAEALRRCDTVLEKAQEHLPALAPYMVTAVEVTSLENLLKAARAHKDDLRDGRTDGTAQTGRISALETEARRIFEGLDLEVESMVEDEEFVDGYFIARRTWDRRGKRREQGAAGNEG